jgi:hypothetical protein
VLAATLASVNVVAQASGMAGTWKFEKSLSFRKSGSSDTPAPFDSIILLENDKAIFSKSCEVEPVPREYFLVMYSSH